MPAAAPTRMKEDSEEQDIWSFFFDPTSNLVALKCLSNVVGSIRMWKSCELPYPIGKRQGTEEGHCLYLVMSLQNSVILVNISPKLRSNVCSVK